MVKPVFRRKSIGTKVSEEEYAQLEALAGGRAMSEWAREVLLRELDGRQARPADETLLADVLALRTILLNAFYKLAQGEKLTAEEMQAGQMGASHDPAFSLHLSRWTGVCSSTNKYALEPHRQPEGNGERNSRCGG